MTPVRALRQVVTDLTALVPRGPDRTWFLVLASLVLQAAFWYLATPGPTLTGTVGRDPIAALTSVAWSVLTLMLVPMLLLRWVGASPAEAGLRLGDPRFGLAAVTAVAVFVVPALLIASADAGLQRTYPWAGAWPGEHVANLMAWALAYALYYLSFEFFYRGFVMRVAHGAWGANVAMWLQVVMATLVHLGKPLPEVLAAAPASLLFGVLALRSRSVLYPALLHLIVGLTVDVAVLARQGRLLP